MGGIEISVSIRSTRDRALAAAPVTVIRERELTRGRAGLKTHDRCVGFILRLASAKRITDWVIWVHHHYWERSASAATHPYGILRFIYAGSLSQSLS
jgi:hypothetical protein